MPISSTELMTGSVWMFITVDMQFCLVVCLSPLIPVSSCHQEFRCSYKTALFFWRAVMENRLKAVLCQCVQSCDKLGWLEREEGRGELHHRHECCLVSLVLNYCSFLRSTLYGLSVYASTLSHSVTMSISAWEALQVWKLGCSFSALKSCKQWNV